MHDGKLNGCRQRLLFARQLIPRKCSLCSQGKRTCAFRSLSALTWLRPSWSRRFFSSSSWKQNIRSTPKHIWTQRECRFYQTKLIGSNEILSKFSKLSSWNISPNLKITKVAPRFFKPRVMSLMFYIKVDATTRKRQKQKKKRKGKIQNIQPTHMLLLFAVELRTVRFKNKQNTKRLEQRCISPI